MKETVKRIAIELIHHAPFTILGAVTGIVIMLIILFSDALSLVSPISHTLFYVFHPLHVVLSAVATTAMYKKYGKGNLWVAILIGYSGAIGIATISDSVIPYLGEMLLNLQNRGIHIGFIEEWQIVNPVALIGIAIGYWKPATEFPHLGHVLISTWASLFHIVMSLGATVDGITLLIIFIFLFLAVWLPCCISDIAFPLLFSRKSLLSNSI